MDKKTVIKLFNFIRKIKGTSYVPTIDKIARQLLYRVENEEDEDERRRKEEESETDIGTEWTDVNEETLDASMFEAQANYKKSVVKFAADDDEIVQAVEISVNYPTIYSDKVIVNIAEGEEDDVIDFYPYSPEADSMSVFIGTEDEAIVKKLLIDLKEEKLIDKLYRDKLTGLLSVKLTKSKIDSFWDKLYSKGIAAEAIPI